jgi:hypothetical protein
VDPFIAKLAELWELITPTSTARADVFIPTFAVTTMKTVRVVPVFVIGP